MLGNDIFDWQIVRKTEKSFLIFLFFDKRRSPVDENKGVHVWVPKKLCFWKEETIVHVKTPYSFEFTLINSKNEKLRISGEELSVLIENCSCMQSGYSNKPDKREAVRIEALDELKR